MGKSRVETCSALPPGSRGETIECVWFRMSLTEKTVVLADKLDNLKVADRSAPMLH
jgi:hypothetical protein